MREGYIYLEKINSIKLFWLLINTHKTQNALFSFSRLIYVHIYQREEERQKDVRHSSEVHKQVQLSLLKY